MNRQRQEELDRAAKKIPFPLTAPLRQDLALRTYVVDEMPTDKTLLPWCAWYIRKEVYGSLSENSFEAKNFDLQKFINFFYFYFPDGRLDRWDKAVSSDFLQKLKKAEYRRATIRRIHATLSAFATFLCDMKLYDYQTAPMRKVQAPPPDKDTPKSLLLLSESGVVLEEGLPVLRRLQDTAARLVRARKSRKAPQRRPIRDFAMMVVLNFTGLRVSELCSLRMSQYDPHLESGGAFFRNVIGKGDKPRDVYMQEKGVAALNFYVREERKTPKSDALFLTFFGTVMTRNNVWLVLKALGRETEKTLPAGQKILINPHRFRHERCYTLIQHGVAVTDVADELGHSNLQYLKKYGDRADKTRAERLKRI